jgi:hypothetical protein
MYLHNVLSHNVLSVNEPAGKGYGIIFRFICRDFLQNTGLRQCSTQLSR